jgi:hypothetical protein
MISDTCQPPMPPPKHSAHVKEVHLLTSRGKTAVHDRTCLQSLPKSSVWHSLESESRFSQALRIVSRAKIVLPSRLMAVILSALHSFGLYRAFETYTKSADSNVWLLTQQKRRNSLPPSRVLIPPLLQSYHLVAGVTR